MTTYVISPTGNDTTGTGSEANPWKTIDKFDGVAAAGDILQCRGGTYFVSGEQGLNATGTPASPITVQPWPGEVPVFDGTGGTYAETDAILDFRSTGDYWILDGLTFQNVHQDAAKCYGIDLGNNGCKGNIIRNCTLHHIWRAGIAISGSDHLIENCLLYEIALHNEDELNLGFGQSACIGTRTQASVAPVNITVRGCTIHNGWGEGVSIAHCDTALIEGNVIYNVYSKCLYVSQSLHVTFRDNNIYINDSRFNKSGLPADGVGLSSEIVSLDFSPYHVDDIQIYNNLFAGIRRGVNWFQDADNTSVRNSYRGVKIFYNTFHQVSQQGLDLNDVPAGNTQPADCEMRNNVVDGTLTLNDSAAWTFSHNNWWNNGVPVSGSHPNSISLDPLFLNPNIQGVLSGFRPLAGSPCLAAATPVSVLDDYYQVLRNGASPSMGFLERQYGKRSWRRP